MTKEQYHYEFAKMRDLYKDSNMQLNKNLVKLMAKYIADLEKKINKKDKQC